MSKLHLYIPTRGRVNMQLTLKMMPAEWKKRTTIVCPRDEVRQHTAYWPTCHVIAQPDSKMTIAQKRKWIFELAHKRGDEKIMMLDDDLSPCPRYNHPKEFAGFQTDNARAWKNYCEKHPDAGALYKTANPEDPETSRAFARVEQALDKYHHVGIAPRLMSNAVSGEFSLNKRMIYALGYRVPTVLKYVKLGRIEHREDMDVCLQLLKKGFENAVYYWCVFEQYEGYAAAGGASLERDMRESNRDAYKLARFHPGLVKAVVKDYKISVPRVEVICYWQKAAADGKNPFLGGR